MADGSVACKLFFTSLNEAVCKLDISATATADAGTPYQLLLKNAANNVVIKQSFTRYFKTMVTTNDDTIKKSVNQTVER